MIDPQSVLTRAAAEHPELGDHSSDAAVQQAMAGLAAHNAAPSPAAPQPGELKYRLTMLLFPAILLVFVALYVTSLASGIDPEVGLFRSGGAALVLAIIGRVAIGIIGDESRLVLNDRQIVAMARSGSVREYLAGANGEHDADGDEHPATTAQAARGGKE